MYYCHTIHYPLITFISVITLIYIVYLGYTRWQIVLHCIWDSTHTVKTVYLKPV